MPKLSTTSAADRVARVSFVGEYDISNAHEITEQITKAAAGEGIGLVVADLADVTFFGSVAARAVVLAGKQLEQLGVALRLDPVHECVDRVLGVLGLPTQFGGPSS